MEVKKINIYKLPSLTRIILIGFVPLLFVCLSLVFFGLPKKIAAQVLIFRGNIAYENGIFDDAEVLYSTALKNDPHLQEALYNLGSAYYKQGSYTEAIQIYKKGLSKKDNYLALQTWNNLGNAYYMEGGLNLSADAYKKALILNSNEVEIQQNLLFVLNKISSENYQAALEKKGRKGEAKKNNKNGSSKTDSNGKETDHSDKSTDNKISESTIVDLFNLINQNEQSANKRISTLRSKNKVVVSDGQDY